MNESIIANFLAVFGVFTVLLLRDKTTVVDMLEQAFQLSLCHHSQIGIEFVYKSKEKVFYLGNLSEQLRPDYVTTYVIVELKTEVLKHK